MPIKDRRQDHHDRKGLSTAHQATIAFLQAVSLADPQLSQAAIARRCNEKPQHFNRAIMSARRGDGSGASLARVAKWIIAWCESTGDVLRLEVTPSGATVSCVSRWGWGKRHKFSVETKATVTAPPDALTSNLSVE